MNDVLEPLIRDIPDFPKPGILFKDITPLLADPAGLSLAVELMANPWRDHRPDLVAKVVRRSPRPQPLVAKLAREDIEDAEAAEASLEALPDSPPSSTLAVGAFSCLDGPTFSLAAFLSFLRNMVRAARAGGASLVPTRR